VESWTFPPRYDADYRPPRGARYWFPVRETMPAGQRDRAILDRLQAVTRYAWEHAPFYRRKWDEAGFHPDHLRTLEDFETKVPVITKRDLREAQAQVPPFGDYLCVADCEVQHVHGTSGTTGRPTTFAIGRGDWEAIANAHARILWGMGVRPGDTGVHRGDLQPLHGLVGHAGRCRAPSGQGVSVRRRRARDDRSRRDVARLMKPAAFYSTPSFALHFAEVARAEGFDPARSGCGRCSSPASLAPPCRACATRSPPPSAPA
jgi:phenylacetate-CoA ligase